jgi:EmrB/QacA subfamily drug resistance transporter
MGMAVVVIANDFTAVNVALPTMEADFDTNINTIQWVINAYALTFGVMIVTGGRLADMFGRRNAFFVGAAIFASMSALGGAAQTETWLIAARVLMGIGGALMWPAILGMTYELLPEEKAGLAGGIIIGAAGLGNAVGPLLGGFLTDELSWRWIFFLNVPIALFAVGVTYLLVHVKEPESGERRIDYPGITTLSVGIVSLLIALDQVDDWGWGDPKTIGLLALSLILVASFVRLERRAGAHALVPREVMRNESFTASCIAILFMAGTFFAALLYLPQFMEQQLGYSALESGLGMLPFLAVFALSSFAAGPLYNRLGAKPLAVVGPDRARTAAALVYRRGLRLRRPGPGDDRARDRCRQLHPHRDHRRRHLGRRLADQPRRRDHLHVPDRRRLDRARPHDGRLLRRGPALRRRNPSRLPARRGALADRPTGRHRLCRRPD